MTQNATGDRHQAEGHGHGHVSANASVTGTVTPPKVTVKLKCKGGTITMKTTDATIKGAFFVSTSKLSGTGKYKKLKGKTKNKGPVAGGASTFVGTATY